MSLGTEAGNAKIMGWAYEMAAWFALTQGDYRGVIVASEAGREIAGGHSVTVQLAAQKAKAWARLGDRRQVEVALDQGRNLLESLPYPTNLDNHFMVDPSKYDFYAMDCYRIVGEDRLAETYAHEVIGVGTSYDGQERSSARLPNGVGCFPRLRLPGCRVAGCRVGGSVDVVLLVGEAVAGGEPGQQFGGVAAYAGLLFQFS